MAFAFTAKEFEAQLSQFYKKELGDIEDAAGIVIRAAADKHVARMKAEASAAFRGTFHRASKLFPQAFRAYHLNPRGELGFASFSRAGPKFMWVFEEGATISPGKFMVVRTDDGTRLQLPRLSHRTTRRVSYPQLIANLKLRFGKSGVRFLKGSQGPLIAVRSNEKWLIVYAFIKAVKLPTVLHFYDAAVDIAEEIPKQIQRLVNA